MRLQQKQYVHGHMCKREHRILEVHQHRSAGLAIVHVHAHECLPRQFKSCTNCEIQLVTPTAEPNHLYAHTCMCV